MGSAGVGVWGSGDERRGGASLSPSPWLWRGGELRRGNAPRGCGGGGLGLGGAVEWHVRKSGALSRRHGDGRSGGREVGPSLRRWRATVGNRERDEGRNEWERRRSGVGKGGGRDELGRGPVLMRAGRGARRRPAGSRRWSPRGGDGAGKRGSDGPVGVVHGPAVGDSGPRVRG